MLYFSSENAWEWLRETMCVRRADKINGLLEVAKQEHEKLDVLCFCDSGIVHVDDADAKLHYKWQKWQKAWVGDARRL